MAEPANKKLYEYVKSLANEKFKSKSGIYRSSWIVREYKKRGGTYIGNKPKNTGLKRWFKEKWVDLNRPIFNKNKKIIGYKECGRPNIIDKLKYPLCRPTYKITSKTPKTYKQIDKKTIEKIKKRKQQVKGTENIQFGGSFFNIFLTFYKKNPKLIKNIIEFLRSNPDILNLNIQDPLVQQQYPEWFKENSSLIITVINMIQDNPDILSKFIDGKYNMFQFGGNEDKPLEVGDEFELNESEVFKITKELGKGSFKSALLAEELNNPTNKVVIFEQFLDPTSNLKEQIPFIKNFNKEIQILNQISKQVNGECLKNIICPIFTQKPGIKLDNSIQHGYIITNYFSGQDLFAFLFENEELNNDYLIEKKDISKQTLFIIKSLLIAFETFHNKIKFAHLDIKPENIMIDSDNNISIIDIGHSCNVTEIECTPAGTMAYIAPEIFLLTHNIHDFELVKKADIWSLGCVIYDIIFQTESIGDVINIKDKKFTENTIEEYIYKNIKYPDSKPILLNVVDILRKMLSYDPYKRPDISEIVKNIDSLYSELTKSNNDISIRMEKLSIDNQTGGKKQFYGKKSSIMVKVPKSVKKWAEYAFELKKLGFKGALETGWKRAKQLATQSSIPIEDLRYMRNWYARHIYTSYPGFKNWVDNGKPLDKSWHDKHAIQSWITWGANPGFKWVNSDKVINLLNHHFDKEYKKIKNLLN